MGKVLRNYARDNTRILARLQQKLVPRKDLLGIEHLPVEVIDHLLDRSDHYYQQLLSDKPSIANELLDGRTIANLFFENSTRTRFSFELAEQRLGGDHISFTS